MLYKWKNVVLQMLLMRLCPSLTANQTRYLLPRPFFCTCLAGYFQVGVTLPLPPNNKDWVLPPRPFIIYYV